MSMSRTHKRLALFMGFAVIFLVALFLRTFYVQVIAAPGLEAKGDARQVYTIKQEAPRGTIYDRNGEALALSRAMATVYANPCEVDEPLQTAAALAPVLGIPQEELCDKLLRTDVSFRYLARRIDPGVAAEVKALKLPGIGVLSEPKRIYPKGSLAPQLLGFVGGEDKGVAGLEYQYEKVLSGEPGETQIVRGRLGNRLSTISSTEPVAGSSITLTIDSEIQFEAEKALTAAVERLKAKRATAIVMDPRSGEILALANTPVFNPTEFGSHVANRAGDDGTRNWAVVDQMEPGSTFKMVAVAAALETGLVTPDTILTLPAVIQKYGKTIHEADENVPETRRLTVTEILAKSSNIGAVTLGYEVGKERLAAMIEKFGFTSKLGIDFPGEAAGHLAPTEKWDGVMIYQVPMGQGIAVSPLQLASAYAAIANDGMLVHPHLVKGDADYRNQRVVSATVADQLRDMLTVTVEEGTGKKARLQGYQVAGKTGTAQKPLEDRRGYSTEVMASFVGMVPADDPRLVILVVVDEPQTERSGAKVAAPVFATIADFALKRLGIPPATEG
jgi:cell division protein FtsI (penicillin-binding protein 3)